MANFKPGNQVYWWKRMTRSSEYPYRAEIVTVGPKRITISVEDPVDTTNRFTRHVPAESLQPVASYFSKAADQRRESPEPVAGWGRFTRYLEIGENLSAVRQVDVFENGLMLSYDQTHWVDGFSMLGDARMNRNHKRGRWGQSEEIESAEFEHVWTAARSADLWPQQVAAARMKEWGAIPAWLTVKGWYPGRVNPGT